MSWISCSQILQSLRAARLSFSNKHFSTCKIASGKQPFIMYVTWECKQHCDNDICTAK